jgi:hypothetical protein
MTSAPIALFVYNRPGHTRQTIEALQRNTIASNSDLVIFSDAPRNSAAVPAVEAVRDYVSRVDGFRSVTVDRRAGNFGLANSIIDGVTRLSEQYGRVIVLEDDLVTSPHFIEYMNAALDRYDSDDRVMQIAGHMFPVSLELDDDALFLPFISSWGWATWQRAWRHFDRLAGGYERLRGDAVLRREFDLGGRYRYFRMLQAQQLGRTESWAIRWYLSVFLRQGLALYPRRTLVKNLGFDGSGVNCNVSKIAQEELRESFTVARFPQLIDVSSLTDAVINGLPAVRPSMLSIRNRVAGLLRRAW